MNSLSAHDILVIFGKVKDIMVENENYLFNLDSKMGDGDLGLTMKNGFLKVDEELKSFNETDIGKIFIKVGVVMGSAVPSTMGTLMATGFMRAGKVIKDKTEIDLNDLILMFSSFTEGIMKQGKSKPGEKTIIDAMLPAVNELKNASVNNKSINEALYLAYYAAKEGLESTKKMTSVHGKAVYHNERSKGTEDPGAAAGVLLLKGFIK